MYMILKRMLDMSISLCVLCLFALPVLLIALLVLLFMGSPVFFKQERPGLNGKVFRLYKFRTMSEAKDSSGNYLSDSFRLTVLGKFLRRWSLDEIPQLLNVINGDMSLVGPRPLLIEYLPLYSNRQLRRHEVRPGITGWAQVNGRNAASWADRFDLDVWYVDHVSLKLDLSIIFRTMVNVIRGVGVSQPGHDTVEKFNGK